MVNCPTCGSPSLLRGPPIHEDDVSYVQLLETNIVIDPKRSSIMRWHSRFRVVLASGEYMVTYDRSRARFSHAGTLPRSWRQTILESIRSILDDQKHGCEKPKETKS